MFQPRREITILGQPYKLACTLRALARFEMRTGLTLADVSADATPGTIRALLWALLLTEHPDMDERTVGCTSDLLGAFETALLLIADSLPRVDPDPEAEGGERSKWMDMWAVARLEMRLQDDQFWNLTPAQWHALSVCSREMYEKSLHGAAMISATFVNANSGEDSPVIQPAAFLPGKQGEAIRAQMEADRRQTLRDKIFGAAEMLGAKRAKKNG